MNNWPFEFTLRYVKNERRSDGYNIFPKRQLVPMRHFHLILRLQLSFSWKDCFDVRMSKAPIVLLIKKIYDVKLL